MAVPPLWGVKYGVHTDTSTCLQHMNSSLYRASYKYNDWRWLYALSLSNCQTISINFKLCTLKHIVALWTLIVLIFIPLNKCILWVLLRPFSTSFKHLGLTSSGVSRIASVSILELSLMFSCFAIRKFRTIQNSI